MIKLPDPFEQFSIKEDNAHYDPENNYGSFTIEPLSRGFGLTLPPIPDAPDSAVCQIQGCNPPLFPPIPRGSKSRDAHPGNNTPACHLC